MSESANDSTQGGEQLSPAARLKHDYLSGADRLRRFYRQPLQKADWEALHRYRHAFRTPRETVVQALRKQYADLGLELFPQQEAYLERLAQPGNFTITTGHQPVLGGGPLFTWYKALSTIKLAEAQNCIPVFWLAGEDHDADELNRLHTTYRTPVRYPGHLAGAVGRVVLEKKHLQAIALPGPLRYCYQAGRTWNAAFICLLHRLLGPYGLLILNADTPQLKAVFRPVLTQELLHQAAFPTVNETGAQLAKLGYPNQLQWVPTACFT